MRAAIPGVGSSFPVKGEFMQRLFVLQIAFFAAFAPFVVIGPARAGDEKKKDVGVFPPVKRGPEHKILESLVGTWDAKVSFYLDPKKPVESTGVMKRKMILGGNFLRESFTGEFVGNKFAGLALIGYDANKRKYVTSWCDSMSTSMALTQGTYDADKKTLTSVGEEYDTNTKKNMKVRDVLKIISADEQLLEMFRHPDGEPAEYKIMEVVFTRKKSQKK
jgi:hypothetical protein